MINPLETGGGGEKSKSEELTTKTYTDARIEGGDLFYNGRTRVGIKLSRPLEHGEITIVTRPQGGTDSVGQEGKLGAITVRVIQDGEVLYEKEG